MRPHAEARAMHVRPATTGDVPVVRSIARETWHAAYDDVLGPEAVDAQVDEWYAPGAVEAWVEDDAVHAVVAEVDGEVVGYATGTASDDGPADAVVPAIYVRPAHWGAGIGSELLATLHDRLRADGHGSVSLVVLAENDVGRSFYAGHGYAVHEERTSTVGGVRARELVLHREL